MSSVSKDRTLVVSWRVREVPIDRLRAWERNPRRISPERKAQLAESLEGDRLMLQARPLVALADGRVFLGNQRLAVAVELGWKTVPAIVVDIPEDQARMWALRDNNPYGEWDDSLLAELLAEIAADGIDLALTGFDSRELDRLLASLQSENDPDDIPDLPEKPDSKLGEVYELGGHLVACTDSTDQATIERLFAGARAELMWTDPPYGVEYVGKTSRRLRIANDSPEGLPELLRGAFGAADRVLAEGGRFYIAAPAGPLGTEFRLALRDTGWKLHQSLVWVKNAPVLGHSDHLY